MVVRITMVVVVIVLTMLKTWTVVALESHEKLKWAICSHDIRNCFHVNISNMYKVVMIGNE